MSEQALNELGVHELCVLMRRRDVKSVDLVEACLNRIERDQEATNAFVVFDRERALGQARALDEQAANGLFAGRLHGIPVAVKDNFRTSDFPTTACSNVHQGKPVGTDATAVARLRNAGAIIIGKTNMHEWAYGATNHVSAHGPTRNPWNGQHITGGSSGGSGAALAARMVPAALGSDTGGSVRIPAAGCGVCGLKPTYGRISRYGVLPLSWSLDVVGPMARSARDLGILFEALAGEDPGDPATLGPRSSVFPVSVRRSTFNIAVLRGDGMLYDDDVECALNDALDQLSSLGHRVEPVDVPGIAHGFGAWKIIMYAEAAAWHARFLDEDGDLYSDNVRMQLEAGRCLSATSYLKAQQYRSLFNGELAAVFDRFDAMLMPTIPVAAPRLDQTEVVVGGTRISSQDAMTSIAWMANMSGLPAVSIPCGTSTSGLPVALTLMGPANSEGLVIAMAEDYQDATDWHRMNPDT